ncbi:MFS transporter [Mycoplasma todarodis]|uniref:MFS transporter n=1 Tax=Mycoplasma todarodis TaxID=1937191 RepID=UPI003B298A7C
MTTLIISIVTFSMILAIVMGLLFKTTNLKRYNIFIYVSLFFFWIAMQIFKQNAGFIKGDLSKPWIWPLIISLYQFTQVAVRIPFGMLSSKFKSRKIVIQISAVGFILTGITLIASNFALWSIILTMMGAGMVGATFGLNSQYWSENWDIKKVFWSSVIMFTVPLLTSSLANIIKQASNINNELTPNGISLQGIRWIILTALIIETIYVVIYTLVKERKETIGLDLGAPEEVIHTSKGYSMVWKLSITASLIAFMTMLVTNSAVMQNMGVGSSKTREELLAAIMILSILGAIITGTYLVKVFSILKIKGISFITMIVAVLVGLVLALTNTRSAVAWGITTVVISVSAVIFQVTLFGSTLHLDHKHPALVLGIFLSVRSFALGSGELISRELIANIDNTKIALSIVFGIATFVGGVSIIFHIINRIKMNTYYRTIQKYEFNFQEKKY